MTKQERLDRERAHKVMELTRDYYTAGKNLAQIKPGMDRGPVADALRKAAAALLQFAPDAYWAAYESAIQYQAP